MDLVLGCGDLPAYYLEFIVTMLGGPLFSDWQSRQRGEEQHRPHNKWEYPGGCENIDGHWCATRNCSSPGWKARCATMPTLTFSIASARWRSRRGSWFGLVLNRLLYGRYLDILITHAPPLGIHDKTDRCHQGFRAFVTFMERFRPRYLIHGHVHVYSPNQTVETVFAIQQCSMPMGTGYWR